MVHRQQLEIATRGRGSIDITAQVQKAVAHSGVDSGLCNVFIAHTSASLMLCENADPEVRADLERFMARLVPDGDPLFRHRAEGADDMPAHVRALLTQSSITVPVGGQRMLLGTWQGIYLWEHRMAPHRRRITVTIYGD